MPTYIRFQSDILIEYDFNFEAADTAMDILAICRLEKGSLSQLN